MKFIPSPLSGWKSDSLFVRVGTLAVVAITATYQWLTYDPTAGHLLANNTLLTISMITREALRVLENNLTFTLRVNRQFDDKFGVDGAKIGSVVNVRKPPQYTVRTGQPIQIQDATEQQVPVPLDKQYGVDLSFTSQDLLLSIDDFSQRFISPAVAAIANRIDQDGLALASQVAGLVGVPGVVPNLWLTYLQAGVVLDNNATPMDGQRSVVINPLMQATLVDALKGLFQQSTAIASQYIKGQMGTSGGFDFYMDQNVYVHTVGALGGAPLANGTTLDGATQLNTKGWTAAAAPRLKAGDVFTVGGVFAVNPQSRQSTGVLRQFVVRTNFSSDASGNGLVQISPAMILTTGFQNITALPVDGAPITVVGTAGTVSPQGLAFHKDAFTFVTADLPLPRGTDMAARMSDKQLGISMRLIRDYDISTDAFPCRLDVLCGWAVLRQELACRIAS